MLSLVEEEIGERAVSLWFNPWLFSSTEELVSRFFSEVAAQLQGFQDGEIRALAGKVAAYGKALAPIAQIVLPGLGSVMQAGSEALSGVGDESGASTHDRHKALAEALRKISRPLVVYVDDIDRLADSEIRDVMRLVKLVGGLPNLIYVLAYDRSRVEAALGGEQPKDGRAFLKIVQVPYSLPPIQPRSACRNWRSMTLTRPSGMIRSRSSTTAAGASYSDVASLP